MDVDAKGAPALVPALGFLAGTCLAARLEVAPGAACALLVALGFALKHPAGRFAVFLALGLVNAELRWLEPRAALHALDRERPAVVVAEIAGHPVRGDDEILLRARTRYVRQGRTVARVGLDVFVTLPKEAAAPPLGAAVRLKGYLRRSPGYANVADPRPGPWRLRLKSARFLEVVEPPGPVAAAAAWVRSRAEEALAAARRRRPESVGLPLVRALLLGDRCELPRAWPQVLRRSGLAHLLAVSGLHVGLWALLLFLASQPLPRSLRYLATIAGVVLYLLLVGPRPAVVRAALMGLLAFGALLAHRPPQALNALAWCVFALVLPQPDVIAELGFQLSFAATAGIVVLAPVYAERWWRRPRWLRRLRAPLAASFAAQVATLPFLVPATGTCHPVAILFNLVAIPWLALFLVAAFVWLAAAVVCAPAAALLLGAVDVLAWPLALAARLPPTSFELQLAALSPLAAGSVAVALAAAGLWPRRAAPLALGLVLVSLTGAGTEAAGPAELVMLDVGQGDAVVVRDGLRAVLVDGGGWPRGDFGGRVLLPALASAGVRRLDAVLSTHGDLDHCGGLADLVRYLPVAEVWTGPGVGADGDCAGRLLAAPGPRHREVSKDEILRVGRWRLTVLHPGRADRGRPNDLSVTVLAAFGSRRVLLAGDLEAAAEAALVARLGSGLRADVLKVAHHGSKTSTTPAWLAAVSPRIALVSAGAYNRYGHPSPAVLERLAGAGARVLRTDRSGRIDLAFYDDGRILISLPASPVGLR